MEGGKSSNCAFDKLFVRNVPHILENIFFSLDYKSFKTCAEVSKVWAQLLVSETFCRKAKSLFQEEILEDEKKLCSESGWGIINEVRRLLSNGLLDVNCVRGDYQSTPLGGAALMGRREVIKLLLDKRAYPNGANNYGWTPLHSTNPRNGNEDIVQLLLERGADPDLETNYRTTLLHLAADNGNIDVMQLLLDRGAKHNTTTSPYGFTPLHSAVFNGHKDIVRLLLNAGAEPNKVNDRGETPLSIAQDALKYHIGLGPEPAAYMDVVAMLNDAMEEQQQ